VTSLICGVTFISFLLVFSAAASRAGGKSSYSGNVTPYARDTAALRAENAVHEAGHVIISRRRGHSASARLWPNGNGGTSVYPRTALDEAVILAAGSAAANLIYFKCYMGITRDDASELVGACRRAGITPDQAYRMAEDEVRANWGAIERAAKRLYENGRI